MDALYTTPVYDINGNPKFMFTREQLRQQYIEGGIEEPQIEGRMAQLDQERRQNEAVIQFGAQSGMKPTPTENPVQFGERAYKEQLKQQETQQNLQTTGTPTGQINDETSAEKLLASAKLQSQIELGTDVSEKAKAGLQKFQSEKTAGGRLAVQQATLALEEETAAQKAAAEEKRKKRRDQLFGGKPYV
jgi:hypothetical protein